MAISSPGLGSNLNVTQIVSQLMAVERQPLDRLDTVEASYQAQLSAYGNVRSALATFSGAVDALSSGSSLKTRTATSSDTTVATGSATSRAETGTYALNVGQLAQAHSVAAVGQSSTTATIGSGTSTTLRFEFGTVSGGTLANGVYTGASFSQNAALAAGTVTIDASNNSLAGIKDAINAANIGVRASIVNDGGTSPYRLVLQSATSGAAASLKVSVSGDATLQSLLEYDASGTQNLTQASAGQDALLTVNGLSLTSASNTLSSAISGVSVNLVKAGTATLTVGRDTSGAQTAVQSFVKAYNDLNATLDGVSAADPATKSKAPLNGDATVRTLQAQLRASIGGSLGSDFSLSTLSQVGIRFERNGTLSLDASKLSTEIGKDADAVAALFAASGSATDSLVSVTGQTSKTKAGSYSLNVGTIATQGSLAGGAAAGLTISESVNDSLTVGLDGVAATVKLSAGTYTATSLATMVQAAINGSTTFSARGLSVAVTQSAGVLTLTSNRYGSTSVVTLSGNAAAGLVGASPVATTGIDVAGSIAGIAGTGSGQELSGAQGSAVEGLKVEVAGGNTGSRGSITVGSGFGERLSSVIQSFVGTKGAIASRTSGINATIQGISSQRDAMERRLSDVQARYLAQFTSLDVMMSKMLQTSSFLTQQLATLNGSN